MSIWFRFADRAGGRCAGNGFQVFLAIVFEILVLTSLFESLHEEIVERDASADGEIDVAHSREGLQEGEVGMEIFVGNILVDNAFRLNEGVIQAHDEVDGKVEATKSEGTNTVSWVAHEESSSLSCFKRP